MMQQNYPYLLNSSWIMTTRVQNPAAQSANGSSVCVVTEDLKESISTSLFRNSLIIILYSLII